MPSKVNSDNFDAEVLRSDKTVIADFYSDSCVPCKRLSPVLAEIEEENADTLKVAKVNINFNIELAEQYGVSSAPTIIFFKEGSEVERLNGAVSKSEIIDTINKI
ncbi:MAG: thioredoxin [Ruminococcus sp.]|nr:thioredoxin [Ruminococcus sp.]